MILLKCQMDYVMHVTYRVTDIKQTMWARSGGWYPFAFFGDGFVLSQRKHFMKLSYASGSHDFLWVAVSGGWSEWGRWANCSKTCGNGVATRYRLCNNPPPAYEGATCAGSDQETTACQISSCPGNVLVPCGPIISRFRCQQIHEFSHSNIALCNNME